MKHALRWMGVFVVVFTAACGEGPPPESAPAPAAARPATEAQREAGRLTEGMVAAVKSDEEPPLALVKFALQSRPDVGRPLKVRLAFIPQVHARSLAATFVADRGLTIPPDQPVAEFDGVEVGAAYPYELTLVPEQAGVFYFSAVVQFAVSGEPRVQTFSVPVLVGPPPPQAS